MPAEVDHTLSLPRDIFFEIFNWLDPVSLKQSSIVNRNWHSAMQQDYLWKKRFERFFPELFAEYDSVQYKNLMKELHLGVDRKQKFTEAYHTLTSEFTCKNEIQDYIALRSCDLGKIEAILARENGHQQVLLIDSANNNIFDFVRYTDAENRQAILDAIFNRFKPFFIDPNTQKSDQNPWGFSLPYDKSAEEIFKIFGMEVNHLIPTKLMNPSLFTLISGLCQKKNYIQYFIKQKTLYYGGLMEIAVRYNDLELFEELVANHLDNQTNLPVMLDDILESNTNFKFHPTIAKYLLDKLSRLSLFRYRLWPNVADIQNQLISWGWFRNYDLGLYFYAANLGQNDFINNSEVKCNPKLSEYGLAYRCALDEKSGSSCKLLQAMLKNGIKEIIKDDYPHMLSIIIAAGDVYFLNECCKKFRDDPDFAELALERAVIANKLDCIRVVLAYQPKINFKFIHDLLWGAQAPSRTPYFKTQIQRLMDEYQSKQKTEIKSTQKTRSNVCNLV